MTLSMKTRMDMLVNPVWTIILWSAVLQYTVGLIGGPCQKDGFFDFIKDRVHERCSSAWIKNDMEDLKESLHRQLFGQHLVIGAVAATIGGHLKNEDPPKALALSFHGWTGVGKTFVSNIIAKSLYKNGIKSKFVHRFYAHVDFVHENLVESYKKQIQEEVSSCVSMCCQCLFIFDEVDKMPPGVFDAIKPYLDHYIDVHDVDYRRNIFIFISNIGAERISNITLEHWKSGKKREDLHLKSIEPVLRKAVYNVEGGLKRSALIEHNLLGTFIPFLPLERQHVKQCILSSLSQKYTEDQIDRVANEFSYYPDSLELYAKTGCSGVTEKAYLIDMY